MTYNGQHICWVTTGRRNETASIDKPVDTTSSRPRYGEKIADELATKQTNDENAALLHTIRYPAEEHCQDRRAYVHWNCQKVGLLTCIAQSVDYRWQKVRHAVDGTGGAPINEDAAPYLPVEEPLDDILPLKPLGLFDVPA